MITRHLGTWALGHLARHLGIMCGTWRGTWRGLSRHMCHAPLRHLARHRARHLGNRPNPPPHVAPAGAWPAPLRRGVQASGARARDAAPSCGCLEGRLGLPRPCRFNRILRPMTRPERALRDLPDPSAASYAPPSPPVHSHDTRPRGRRTHRAPFANACPHGHEPSLPRAPRPARRADKISELPAPGAFPADPLPATLIPAESGHVRLVGSK